jgi:hypothetical protein
LIKIYRVLSQAESDRLIVDPLVGIFCAAAGLAETGVCQRKIGADEGAWVVAVIAFRNAIGKDGSCVSGVASLWGEWL